MGLAELKTALLTGLGNEVYIPQSLLRSDKHLTDTQYLLSNFGGLKEKSKKKIKTVMKANIFLKSLKEKAASSKSLGKLKLNLGGQATDLYAPEKWLCLPAEKQQRLREILSWESLSKWDFPIFELYDLTDGNPLLFMGWAVLASPHAQEIMDKTCDVNTDMTLASRKGYKFMDVFKINPKSLIEFLMVIETEYKDNPYHNRTHAADVTQSLHALLEMGGKQYVSEHIQLLAVLLSAVVHDVGHPGYNNAFQKNSKSELALVYNDQSILENMHLARTFEILMGKDKSSSVDILTGLTEEQCKDIRTKMIDAVLHTDMTMHFTRMAELKGLIKLQESADNKELTVEQKWQVLGFLLHIADISNPAKQEPVFIQWADLCLEEFFRQGDLEKSKGLPISPLCDRDTTERAASQYSFTAIQE